MRIIISAAAIGAAFIMAMAGYLLVGGLVYFVGFLIVVLSEYES